MAGQRIKLRLEAQLAAGDRVDARHAAADALVELAMALREEHAPEAAVAQVGRGQVAYLVEVARG